MRSSVLILQLHADELASGYGAVSLLDDVDAVDKSGILRTDGKLLQLQYLVCLQCSLAVFGKQPITVSTSAAELSSLARVERYSFTFMMPASTVSSHPSFTRLPRVMRIELSQW